MFEDINHSGDGGIHAQLLRNNGFQGENATLTAYNAVGGTTLAVDFDNPLSQAIQRSLRVSVAEGTTGQVGFSNEGYWGIQVNQASYTTAFYIKGQYEGDVTIKLVGNFRGTEYGSRTVSVKSNSSAYSLVETSIDVNQAPDGNNLWTVTFDAARVAGGSLNFDLVQLYPPTFRNRYNGLKPFLADPLDAIKGSFLRFPGGNNLEGSSENTRWKWNETIGPLKNRPAGRQGDWTYPNTDALGLLEYFYWCEDMNLTPILVVWAGFSLNSGGNTPITGPALEPYIDDVMRELEYILGDTTTEYGALRASHGQAEPLPLSFVEIGNEDNLGGGNLTYPERFMAFYDRIHAAYPDITLITSHAELQNLPDPRPAGIWMDFHTYAEPDQLVANSTQFDNVDRAFPYFVGEYAVIDDAAGERLEYPNMQAAVAESVYAIGMERNSDVVKMAAYAPLLQHLNDYQWTPNLISFNNDPDSLVLSTSYYVQQMFSVNRGHTILPVTADSAFGPLYWVASKSDSGYFVKMANYGGASHKVSVAFPQPCSGVLTMLAGDQNAQNTNLTTLVTPSISDIMSADGNLHFTMPGWSVAVLDASPL
ncbi:hypothetical protein H2199_001202 [Coniosporium tulheliwenetii]|uniref:Uncharacterized protein n=1 Tax=Coniosporium tulheliwenetii TaxID=3383036 RepID=A0ACC2ZL97_9PEZI|nr:hypothetical protein H2199_001202 [Cladosporium sp. JES 115]